MTGGTGRRGGAGSPTLRDVAARAEVSLMTVSNVVNGHVGRVGEATRLRIEAAIAELGYRTQRRGRSLKLAREFAVGLAVVHPDRRFLDDPFISYVASGMSNALAAAGYGLMVNGIPDLGQIDLLLRHAMHIDALAIIASGPRPQRRAAYRRLAGLPHPLVVIEDEPQRGLGDTCTVLLDDGGGGAALARHLLARGARRFLFVAPRHAWPAVERREAGFAAALPADAVLERLACDETDHAGLVAAIAAKLSLKGHYDAVAGANDQIGIAALAAADRRGLDVPGDLRITGFNGFTFRHYAQPLLTTVLSPAYGLGERVARLVLDRLDGQPFPRGPVMLDVALEVGLSS